MVAKTREEFRRKGLAAATAGGEISIAFLSGVKDLKIGEVTEYEEKIVVKASLKKAEAEQVDREFISTRILEASGSRVVDFFAC